MEDQGHLSDLESRIHDYSLRGSPLLGPGELWLSPSYWRDRRVVVTGGEGFLGSHVVERLRALGCRHITVPHIKEYDLTELEAVQHLYKTARPDTVIHLAALINGIAAKRTNPGRFFYANMIMGVQLIEEARKAGVEKFVQLGSVCAYPKFTPVPFREEDLWNGYPEGKSAPYGIATKALLVQLQAYREQYGFNGIYLIPSNLYGPGDNLDPAGSHVIPALIRKMLKVKEAGHTEVWISGTGQSSREFLYVGDCARAVLLAAEHYDCAEPVNVGTGQEIKIKELATLVAEVVGFDGKIVLDPTALDGQPRFCLDTSKAVRLFGFQAHVPLRDGLSWTVRWYQAQRNDLYLEEDRLVFQQVPRA